MFGGRFSSSINCSRWLSEIAPGRHRVAPSLPFQSCNTSTKSDPLGRCRESEQESPKTRWNAFQNILERSWKSRYYTNRHSLSLVTDRESETHFIPKLIAEDIVPLPKRSRDPALEFWVVFL